MFFTKADREKLDALFTFTRDVLVKDLTYIIKQNQYILKHMATRQELDAALKSENEALQKAAERHQKMIAEKTEALMDAINNLSSKHENEEDFSAELAEVNQHITDLNQIAQTPLAATPAGTSATTAAGAAGHTVGGPEMHAEAVASGAKEPKPEDHAGSAVTEAEPEVTADAPTTPKLEWGTGDNKGMVRELPDGAWREPTPKEVDAHQSE